VPPGTPPKLWASQLIKPALARSPRRLAKDATRWGAVEGGGDEVVFALWPPWVAHRAELPEALVRPALPPPPRPLAAGQDAGAAEAFVRRPARDAGGLVGVRGLFV
jgi:hypothetical protein